MDQRSAIAAIRKPTLMIAGRSDQVTAVDHARLIVERVPGAKLVELNALHFFSNEDETRFTTATLEFLGR
jgi:3-oxoadipate enol-lactonase